jgi:hypothetical protein
MKVWVAFTKYLEGYSLSFNISFFIFTSDDKTFRAVISVILFSLLSILD